MNRDTGVITHIGTMNAVPGNTCNMPMGTCLGNTVRNLYMGPDQQLYGTAWPLDEMTTQTFLYKIDKNTAQATNVCEFLPFGLTYSCINVGIDSAGLVYWKVPRFGAMGVRRLNMGTCALSVFIASTPDVTATTLYYDKLYFINATGYMLRVDPPSTTVIDTGYNTGIIYNVPIPGLGDVVGCDVTDENCWMPTTFFPYIDSTYTTDLRAAHGTLDKSTEPFYILNPETTTTTLFLNRSISGTSQIVYGAAPTCYHNITVNIPPLAKRDGMVYAGAGVMYFSAPIPASYPTGGGGSLLSLYDRASMTIMPMGRMGNTENITKLMMSPGGQLYAVSESRVLYTITGTSLNTVCTLPAEVSAVFGFHGPSTTVLVQDSVAGTIAVMSPTTCAINPLPVATYTCVGGAGAVVNDVLYCVTTTDVISITFGGVVTTVGTHSVSPLSNVPRVLGYCHGGGPTNTLTMYSQRKFFDINTSTGVLSNQEDFDLGAAPYEWYPSSSVWCA